MPIPDSTTEVASHTPGPWRLVDCRFNDGKKNGQIQVIAGVVAVAGLYGENSDANGHLIAAAPRMLAKLREIHSGMACSCRLQPLVDGPVPCETCQIAAVISEAEGRS